MSILSRKVSWISALALLYAVLWISPASASPKVVTFTVDWTGYPFILQSDEQPPSPFYDCFGWSAGGLHCEWLWEQGLKVSRDGGFPLPMYGDWGPWYDLYGVDVTQFSPTFTISAECLPGFHPCFHTFTPREMTLSLGPSDVQYSFDNPTDITEMSVGLPLPDACLDPELDCPVWGFQIMSLTFDATPIPEPVSPLLLGAGLLAVLRRHRRK